MEYLNHPDNRSITNRIARGLTGIKSENSMKVVFWRLRDRGLIRQVPGKAGFASAWEKGADQAKRKKEGEEKKRKAGELNPSGVPAPPLVYKSSAPTKTRAAILAVAACEAATAVRVMTAGIERSSPCGSRAQSGIWGVDGAKPNRISDDAA